MFAVFFALGFAFFAAQAEDLAVSQAVAESAVLADEAETLEGISVAEPTNIPSGFGFWWNDLKDNLSLAMTFDPVKKAEKQLLFAAQRLKLAEYMIQNSTDAKIQEKAQQLLSRANEYAIKVADRKDQLIQNMEQNKAKNLLSNTVKQQMNLELALDKVEDKITPEKLAAFQERRAQIEANQEQLLENLKNSSNVPQAVKDKIAEVKVRIQIKLQDREAIRSQQEEILDGIKAGREEARAALQQLIESRGQAADKARQEYKDFKTVLVERIKSGDQEAAKELIQVNKTQGAIMQKIFQDAKIQAGGIRAVLRNTATEARQELQQNQSQQRIKNPSPVPSVSPAANR